MNWFIKEIMESCDNKNHSYSEKYLCKIKPYTNEKYNNQKFPLSYRQSCSVYERLSKKTFLELLGRKSEVFDGISQNYFYGKLSQTNCTIVDNFNNIECKTVYSPIREYFDNLEYSSWSITSFDSKTRKVCIEVKSSSGPRYLSVMVPEQISKPV